MWFLMGTDGAARSISPVAARNMLLGKARQQADQVFNLVQHLQPAERREALRTALNAFKPEAASRVEITAVNLTKQGMTPPAALREALGREMASMTMSLLTKKGHEGMLQGLADAWLDLRDQINRGEGLSGVWKSLKKGGKAVLGVAKKVAKGVYNIACSKVGKFAGPIVGKAAGGKKVGKGISDAQAAACGKKKRKKAALPALPAHRGGPPRMKSKAPPPPKSKLPLYLAVGGGALLLSLLAVRSPAPAPAPGPMVITTGIPTPAPAPAPAPARAV